LEKAPGDSTMKVARNKNFIEEEYPMAHTNHPPYLSKNAP